MRSWLAALVFLISWATGFAGEIALRAGAPLRLLAEQSPLPPTCQFQSTQDGALVSCQPEGDLRLVVAKEGFEPKNLFLSQWGKPLDLRQETWTPLPVLLTLDPPPLAAGALLLWQEGKLPRLSQGEGQRLLGPRVGEEPITGLLVGPFRGLALTFSPPEAGTTRPVHLEEGHSAAVACQDPWRGELVHGCQGLLGYLPQPVGKRGEDLAWAWSLIRPAEGQAVGDFLLFQVPERRRESPLFLLLQAPELPPVLWPFSPDQPFTQVPFPKPLQVRLTLRTPEDEGVEGKIQVAKRVGEVLLSLGQWSTDPRGSLELTLAAETYTFVASAPGFAAKVEEITLGAQKRRVDLVLAKRPRLRGQVRTPQGEPVPQAVVLSVGASRQLESMENLAQTDEGGFFQLTLPPQPPWTLLAEKEGFRGIPLEVSSQDEEVLLLLVPSCQVHLHLFQANGSPLEEPVVVAFPAQGWQPALGKKLSTDGSYVLDLTPGLWTLFAEEARLWGTVKIPETCSNLHLSLTLLPKGQSNVPPR